MPAGQQVPEIRCCKRMLECPTTMFLQHMGRNQAPVLIAKYTRNNKALWWKYFRTQSWEALFCSADALGKEMLCKSCNLPQQTVTDYHLFMSQ